MHSSSEAQLSSSEAGYILGQKQTSQQDTHAHIRFRSTEIMAQRGVAALLSHYTGKFGIHW
jgi:hypothetical protein